jgi:hypothetical protein
LSRWIWVGFSLGGFLLALRGIRQGHIRELSVQNSRAPEQANLAVHWQYTAGQRPLSLIIDIVGANGVGGSLTTTGQRSRGEIPLAGPLMDPYQATVTLTYRRFGVVRTATQQFTGNHT